MSALDVVLVVLFEDNSETETVIWIDAANVLGIPSVVIPFTIADATEPAESHYPDPLFHAHTNKYNEFVAANYPRWVMRHKDRDVVRRIGIAAIAAEWLGLTPPLPWILNSTRATAVAIESDAGMEHYRRLGLPNSKLIKTGSLADDVLFRSRVGDRLEALAQFGFSAADRVILCAFPPNQLTAIRPNVEFTNYAELVEFWIRALSSHPGWRVIVRPHPFMVETDVKLLYARGAIVSMEHTASLVPLCDVYVASVSSTIRWAIGMGKPVVNYDVFGYNYSDFDRVPSVIKATTKQAFASTLARLTSDAAYLSEITAAAQREAARWAEIDGGSGERIIGLFDSLSTGGPSAFSAQRLRPSS